MAMAGGGESLGEKLGIREELIKKACFQAVKAHRSSSPKKLYLCEKTKSSSEAIFSFPGSWSLNDWYTHKPFGETKINISLFPSLRSIGNDEVAASNEAFVRRFEIVLSSSQLEAEVERAVSEKKQIIFAGHSSGGPMAIFATLWFLDKYLRPNTNRAFPVCLTFGSPLAGDSIFPHALRREDWARRFIHFVMRYDIVPRIMLSPLSSIEQIIQPILSFFDPKSPYFDHESIANAGEALAFFIAVMRNASTAASHAACNLMGCTNLLLETVSSFVQLSPYRPFGTHVFISGNGRLVVVKNPDAVLQLLFYCLQLKDETEGAQVAYKSLKEHFLYENELQDSLTMQNVVYLDDIDEIPLSSDASSSSEVSTINAAFNDLGLGTRARLCLRAVAELEKQKLKNQETINAKKKDIKESLDKMREYQTACEVRKVGYYDAFKLQKDHRDFEANVKRLELAGIWDEIVEMLKRYELPDGFESQKEWIELGTMYRRLVEPLDIANYYRHLKNEDTGPYLVKGRPKRYRYTQRWHEHAERITFSISSDSCFWAEVEELRANSKGSYEIIKQKILALEDKLVKWVAGSVLGQDVFLDESTFTKWWKTLPHQHKSVSPLIASGQLS